MPFNKYKKNFYSQHGEDGVIRALLKKTGLSNNKNKWCCEFGAWDGKHGSNTFNLIEKSNFKGVYIEGDSRKFKLLKNLSKTFSNIYCFNKFVSHKTNSINSLDSILKKTNIKKNFEVLSIDIDSHDLAVWDSLSSYFPAIVVIEINCAYKPGVFQIHNEHGIGNSFSSVLKIAKKKGYILVCHTGNCIFIKKKYTKKIKIPKKFIYNQDLLFDWSWYIKKENFLKKFLKKVLPNIYIEKLKVLKNNLFKQF